METPTLHSPDVTDVLNRLLAAEAEQDAAAGDDVAFPADEDPAHLAEAFKDTYMSVSATGGELLYLLARSSRARTVVEFGTSFGVSAIYLAAAVRDNGGGTVTCTELNPDKAAAAQRNFADAGVADLIDLRVGDARETLTDLDRPVDLLLLDGWPNLALPVLQTVEHRLHRGSLIVIDDVDRDWGADLHGPVLRYLAGQPDRYLSVHRSVGDGMQVCLRMS